MKWGQMFLVDTNNYNFVYSGRVVPEEELFDYIAINKVDDGTPDSGDPALLWVLVELDESEVDDDYRPV